MELQVIANGKNGVIHITNEQFIIEDLKAHICKKMGLDITEYKVKVACGNHPSIELIKTPSFSFNQPKEESNIIALGIDNVIDDFSKYHDDIRDRLTNELNEKVKLIKWINNDFFHITKGEDNLAIIGKDNYLKFSKNATDHEINVISKMFNLDKRSHFLKSEESTAKKFYEVD